MFQNIEPWRVADHDDTEIYSADGRIYVGTCASADNARLAAALAAGARPDRGGIWLRLHRHRPVHVLRGAAGHTEYLLSSKRQYQGPRVVLNSARTTNYATARLVTHDVLLAAHLFRQRGY